ncbi:50S ribosomal protein L1 [Candidatus Persebacteraceae bacterium Df01]|jgi:large subunit ribosomal protein L1|uniref:Large ribosomal subunit protein uL1 n=1 Tax=Candidatus Doriopsillibacter californiensis TaxID=2970740 RepID=A0ABT7QPB9_9GAMM|nr:50S ribosomal protein L1 [Candidatus Persebacteraceae bacterium Df01]
MAKIDKRLRDKVVPEKGCSLDEALAAVVGGSGVKFDETVDVAVHLGIDTKKSDQAVRGAVVMPAGTGKTVRVAVVAADADAESAREAGADRVGFEDLIEEIKGGKTDFDVLIATPTSMRHLAAAGRVLGPRGLMPNPKTGTVAAAPAEAVKNAKAGQVRYRADKAGIVHAPVGKASFTPADLKRNIESLLDSLKRAKPASSKGVYLRQLSLSSTMGRSVEPDIASYR